MGHCGHRPGLPGTAGALLPAPNFVGLAPQGIRSSSLRAQAGDFRGRAGLGRRRPVGSLPERASGGATQAGGRGPGGGSPPLPPGGRRHFQRRRGGPLSPRPPLPPSPAGRLGPAPRSRGGPRRAGWAPGAALHGRAPSAGVRPSRGYITGLGPSGAAGGLGVQAVGGRDVAAHLP